MNIFLHLFGQPVCIVISLFLLINDVRMITFTHQLLKTVKPWQKLPQPHGAMVHQQCRWMALSSLGERSATERWTYWTKCSINM